MIDLKVYICEIDGIFYAALTSAGRAKATFERAAKRPLWPCEAISEWQSGAPYLKHPHVAVHVGGRLP